MDLKKALRKVVSTSSRVDIRFDITATIDGLQFPSNSYTSIARASTGDSDSSIFNEANQWIVANLPQLVEANVTRIEMILADASGIKRKQTLRVEELASALEVAGTDTDQDRILGLWQGPELNDDQKEFLTAIYKDYHGLGEGAVDTNNLFDKKKSNAYHDIYDRLWEHPKAEDRSFIEKLSKGDKSSMDEIMWPSAVKGYAVDFAYEVYEKYFMDSVPVELDEEELEEKGLKEAQDEVDFLARAAITDGCEEAIGKCARDWIEEETKLWLEDNKEETESD